MRFRMSEYSITLIRLSIIIFSFFVCLCCVGAILLPSGRGTLGMMTAISAIGLISSIQGAQLTGFPWISFDASGVKKKWLFNVNNSILWTECADIGVLRTDVGSWGIHNWRYWIYFSKVPLTHNQIFGKENLKTINGQFIMLEYRPAVLDEILKYIEKGQIRNLHLLER